MFEYFLDGRNPDLLQLINTLNLILILALLSVVPFFLTWGIMKFVLHKKRAKTVAVIVTIIVFVMMFAVSIARDYQISKSYWEKLREENAKTDMEISSFKQIIGQAVTTNDITLCNSIPKPIRQNYLFDDYVQSTPSQEQWIVYCNAMVNNDVKLCDSLYRYNEPDLFKMCNSQLGK